jgi:16S rRNA (cytosine967-C5)-methyltransferase
LKPETGKRKSAISPARTAAFDILLRVERESSYASELLHSAGCERLSAANHGLATELVMGVLRWRSLLDDEITAASSQPLAKLDLEVLIAIRLALYQLRWLNRIPARAAIHQSVELVKRARKHSAAAFVNAVLRKLANTAAVAIPQSSAPSSAQDLARNFAHPPWLVERWINQYGFGVALRICQYNQSVPTTAIRLRVPSAEAELRAEGIVLAPGALLVSARRLQSGDSTKTHAYRAGHIVIQDEASQLVAALVGSGSRVLDCCAAPGGKTLAIADRNPAASITAAELHPHRARLLKKLLRRQDPDCARLQQNVRVVTADARSLPTDIRFDRILTDVPCSGTGTLARNPEIKWRLKPEDIIRLQAYQIEILSAAMKQVAPGGQILYSTCSLEPEENEDVIGKVLQTNTAFRVLDVREHLEALRKEGVLAWQDVESLVRGPYLRTIPGVHPCDGFFGALLERAL